MIVAYRPFLRVTAAFRRGYYLVSERQLIKDMEKPTTPTESDISLLKGSEKSPG